MLYQILFVVSLIALLVACGVAALAVLRRPLKPFARALLTAAIVLEIVIAALHLLSTRDTLPAYWSWFFDMQYERNLGALFSALQLMLVAAVALVNSALSPGLKAWQRAYWLLLAATFAYLSVDEFYMIHETFGGRALSNNWELPYAISGGVLFLVSAAAFWFGFRREGRVFGLLFAGMVILAMGAVAMETFVRDGFVDANPSLRWMFIFEELFEMIGATIVLAAFLSYASAHLEAARWRAAARTVGVVAIIWGAWLVVALTLLPALEARYLATPVEVDYDGGRLSLVGYRITPDVIRPGDELALTLFWRANQPLTTDYSVSVHVLGHPEIDSVVQADDLHAGAIPSTAWFPNIVSSKTLYIPVPRNLPTPASYWLTLRVWSGPWPLGRPWSDTTGLPVSRSEDRALLGEDSVILASIPALPREGDAPPPADEYVFASEGFTLEGFALPQDTIQTHELNAEFWWQTTREPQRDLTQFFHLIPQNGADVFAFDQQPFAGRFPTLDWVPNAAFKDTWRLDVPDDVPEGTYDVYTGLYDLTTMERAAVTDANGNPVPNNAVHLGTITYAPDPAVEAEQAQNTPGICYAVADSNSRSGSEADTLVVMNTETGETLEINPTGTIKVEGITFNADNTGLYAADERQDDGYGQFGMIDLATGGFTPIGDGLATEDDPARNRALGESNLQDIDSIARDPQTGIVWGIHQDEQNYLFQIDPESGEFVPNGFGRGNDYIKLDLTDLPAPGYVNVKDLAIHPETGEFYVLVGNDAYDARLAIIDFETVDRASGTVQVIALNELISTEDGAPIRDVEALTFTPSGVLYAISSNNSGLPENDDRLWQIDPATGSATPVGNFAQYVDYVDYEAAACLDPGAPHGITFDQGS